MWPFGNDSGSPASSTIPFTHTVSNRARRLTIKIDRKGQVIVVTPRFIPKLVVDQFVAKHTDWITEKLSKFTKRDANTDVVQIFGKDYLKVKKYLPKQKLGILISGKSIVFNTPEVEFSAEKVSQIAWGPKEEKALERFLKSTAQAYVITRTEQLAKKMKIQYGHITLREQSSRWGSCSSLGNLNFNWRLVHATPPIIDYVIIHELAHRTHMDHSRNFWNLVAQYDPDYQIHRGWLKRQGHELS